MLFLTLLLVRSALGVWKVVVHGFLYLIYLCQNLSYCVLCTLKARKENKYIHSVIKKSMPNFLTISLYWLQWSVAFNLSCSVCWPHQFIRTGDSPFFRSWGVREHACCLISSRSASGKGDQSQELRNEKIHGILQTFHCILVLHSVHTKYIFSNI